MSQPTFQIGTKKRLHRPLQFSIRQLLFLTLGLALLLGFYVCWYPYSEIALGVLLFSIPVSLAVLALRQDRSLLVTKCILTNAVFYMVATLVGSGCIDLRGPVRSMSCRNNLKAIMLALHVYRDRYGTFPPAYVCDAKGHRMHSWRVLLLPYLEEQALYAKYHFDEPWDGPNNRQLASTPAPSYFACPEAPSGTRMTSYVAVVGTETAWPGAVGRKLDDFSDGTSNTVMVAEVADSGIHWMEPRDPEFSKLLMSIGGQGSEGISSLHREDSWWHRLLGAHAAFADGDVQLLSAETPAKRLRALLTIAGSEPVEFDEPN